MPLKIIRRAGSPHWQLQGTVGGQRVRESTGTPDRQRAEIVRIRREAELLDRHAHGPKAVATFPEALNIYLDRGGEARFVGKLLKHFKTTRLADIDQWSIELACGVLYPTAAPATVNRQLIGPMTAIMNVGADCGLCDPPRFKRRKVKSKPRRAVTPEWLSAVIETSSPHLAALLGFMALTGARISEAVNLTWADVDLAAGHAVLQKTKTEPRRVPFGPALVVLLAKIPGSRHPTARVFKYAHRSSPIDALKTACKRAGVEIYSFHEIGRHTFATWMLQDGNTLNDTADAGGWKSIALVKDIYGHLEQGRTDVAVRALERRLQRRC